MMTTLNSAAALRKSGAQLILVAALFESAVDLQAAGKPEYAERVVEHTLSKVKDLQSALSGLQVALLAEAAERDPQKGVA